MLCVLGTAMATPESYREAVSLVFDPVRANRHTTHNALRSLGFHEVALPMDLPQVRKVLGQNNYDVFFADITDDEENVCKLVRDIRSGTVGNNPFIVIVLTTWNRNAGSIRLALNSGADDLIARPFSIGQIKSRLKQHVSARKKFVVTSTYFGPDRRTADRHKESDGLFEVPNTLQARVTPSGDINAVLAQIDALHADAFERKRVLVVGQIAESAKAIAQTEASPLTLSQYRAHRSRLKELGGELNGIAETTGAKPMTSLCDAILQMEQALPEHPDGLEDDSFGKNIQLLSETAAALKLTINPEAPAEQIADNIAETVKVAASLSQNVA